MSKNKIEIYFGYLVVTVLGALMAVSCASYQNINIEKSLQHAGQLDDNSSLVYVKRIKQAEFNQVLLEYKKEMTQNDHEYIKDFLYNKELFYPDIYVFEDSQDTIYFRRFSRSKTTERSFAFTQLKLAANGQLISTGPIYFNKS